MPFWETEALDDRALDRRPEALETERLVLLPLSPEHASALFSAFNDPAVFRYIPSDTPHDTSVLEVRYRRTSAGPSRTDERWWNWAVATRERPGVPFGTVEVTLRDNGANALLGYVFGRATWGRGFAFEACGAAISYVCERARPERIDAYVDTRNERSIRLAERLGFRHVETLAGADYFKGSTSDEYRFSLLLPQRKECDG